MDRPSFDKIIEKLERFCAYQERCVFEVKQKLYRMEVPESFHDEIIVSLKSEGFVDDERFTSLYVRSKVNQKGWGIVRLRAELRRRKIPQAIVDSALNDISDERESEILLTLLFKKQKEIKQYSPEKQREKMIRYALGKGYSLNSILNALKAMNVKTGDNDSFGTF